ncbi:MAG: PorV/PorQ family protein, partial [Bacteroidetes bacterium]|nr:PorV/PorQ family protein [Bacteroidota bacterium]
MVPTPDVEDLNSNRWPDYREQSVFKGIMVSFYDAPGGFSEEIHEIVISSGVEYSFRDMIFLRTGYFNEHATKGGRQFVTVGAGLEIEGFTVNFS